MHAATSRTQQLLSDVHEGKQQNKLEVQEALLEVQKAREAAVRAGTIGTDL